MFKKDTYYFIDESGDLSLVENGGSKIFIIGCAIVNNLERNLEDIKKLKTELNNSAFFERHKKNKYFHACEDHLDIYSRFVEMLNNLDFRAYIVVLNKTTKYFKELIKIKDKEEICEQLTIKLLSDRLLDKKLNNHFLTFEGAGSKLVNEKMKKEKIIRGISDYLKKKALIDSDLNFSVEIKNKDEQLLSIIDYVIHIVGRLYEGKKRDNGTIGVEEYMKHNFRLIEPKIALVFDLEKNKYFVPRKDDINIDDFFISS